jgi:3'-phosphoadenosine 5'-phosphosulfate (PAPS) 3'-phosphatase
LYFNQEDAVVWLDPLDGTKGFLTNDLSEVTNNIGK